MYKDMVGVLKRLATKVAPRLIWVFETVREEEFGVDDVPTMQ